MTDLSTVLKPYTCHKNVTAAEITSVGNLNGASQTRPVTLAGRVTVDLSDAMFVRYQPVPGDFLVVYEDGYKSFSPRQAFLDGYKPTGESFADIKKGIRDGQQADPDQT